MIIALLLNIYYTTDVPQGYIVVPSLTTEQECSREGNQGTDRCTASGRGSGRIS
jgi:hypothetical protein